ncbi:IclR family transcriptional regulator [Pseudooceanicola aestuarii]|uniref:IclR family transcriptional regulator n=1 Tax=Pseudooceanicola aestuarii TaxID=2697319 RepID=UPI0013D65962|nr:IclR family transcriptional regulator [Pseudooceanicola aestuarii]
MDYTISSVDRALRMLEALADNPGSGVTELAAATGCTKSQTFRLLFTLEARGFVTKDADRRYTLGFRAMLLGDQARRQSRLIAAAEPFLHELYDRLRENVLLLVRDGLNSVCILLRSSPDPDQIFAQVGRHGPLYAGGGPKVLLAHARQDIQDAVLEGEMQAFTDGTIRDPDVLRSLLDQIRRDGWTISEGELDLHKCSVAAPVRDASGMVIAALSVTGAADRLRDTLRTETRDALVSASGRLSVALGYRGTPVVVS